MLLIKEGDTTDMLAYTINKILMDRSEKLPMIKEDFYKKIIEIYEI